MSNKTKIQGHNTAIKSLKNILAVPMEKHGLYVWRKFKYKPAITVQNPQFDISCSNSAIVTIANPNFDPSKVENYIDFFDGLTATTTSTGHDYFKKENGVLKFCVDSTNYTVNSYDGGTGTFTIAKAVSVARTYAYAGTKNYSEEKKTFIDFVVSDIESAYPDGGLKDGYWYEKEKLSGAFLNGYYTKCAVDKFTFATDTNIQSLDSSGNSVKFKHSLGAKPKLAVLIGKDIDISGSSHFVAAIGLGTGNGILRGPFIYGSKYHNPTGGGVLASGEKDTPEATDADHVYIYLGTVAVFEGGKEYALITFA